MDNFLKSFHLKENQTKTKQNKGKKLDLSIYTSLERNQFIRYGLYPLETTKKWKLLIHNIKLTILSAFSSILFLSMVISLSIGDVDNLSEVTAILYYLITQSAYLFKLVNFVIQRNRLPLIEKHLKFPTLYKYYNIYGHADLDQIIRIAVFCATYFRFCVTVVFVFYILFPLLSEDTLLPFAGWMPVDKAQYRGIIFTIQMCCFTLSAYTNSSFDIYTTYYISLGVAQLRLLKTCLRNIDYSMGRHLGNFHDDDSNKRIMYTKDDGETKLSPEMLGELYLLHEHAFTFINMIEDTFSYGIFIQFLASIAVICLTGFQMLVVSPASLEFILLLFYFLCMMCQVVLYCWFGNEIEYESNGIGEACYMSNWYEADMKTKKVLFLIMERSKRNINLTAGKFFILTLSTLVKIIKSSYSYFAVLQRIYKEV